MDGETIKVEDQIELCTDEIVARGAVLGEVFRDNSQSAWKPSVVRGQDALAAKTASWGVARVDRSMGPILSTIDTLRGELATLQAPDSIQAATADAVAAWRDARERGDVELMRRMIRSAFPGLAVALPSGRGDHSPTRILWTGSPTPG